MLSCQFCIHASEGSVIIIRQLGFIYNRLLKDLHSHPIYTYFPIIASNDGGYLLMITMQMSTKASYTTDTKELSSTCKTDKHGSLHTNTIYYWSSIGNKYMYVQFLRSVLFQVNANRVGI